MWNKMKKPFYICLLLCLCSCDHSGVQDRPDAGSGIWLSARVEGSVATKKPYVPYEDADSEPDYPTSERVLSADVWGSTVKYLFKHELKDDGKPYDGSGTDGKVAIHTNASFRSGDPQLLSAAIYGKGDGSTPEVYFVAFHPMGWTTAAAGAADEGKVAAYSFDGNDDVMFAPQVSGHYATDYEKSPQLYFRHLLTWLRIEVKAESETVSDAWGKITAMTLKSKNKVTVNLSESAYLETTEDSKTIYTYKGFEEDDRHISFSGEVDMAFFCTEDEEVYVEDKVTVRKKFTDERFPAGHSGSEDGGYKIPGKFDSAVEDIDPVEVAYVMCAPVVATDMVVVDGKDVDSAEYEITVVTEKRTVTVPVDLRVEVDGEDVPYKGSTRCRQFTLSLLFKMGNTVSATVYAKDWIPDGVIVSYFGDGEIK